jgi:hypothetical protein
MGKFFLEKKWHCTLFLPTLANIKGCLVQNDDVIISFLSWRFTKLILKEWERNNPTFTKRNLKIMKDKNKHKQVQSF